MKLFAVVVVWVLVLFLLVLTAEFVLRVVMTTRNELSLLLSASFAMKV